jgi:hypothetical protein
MQDPGHRTGIGLHGDGRIEPFRTEALKDGEADPRRVAFGDRVGLPVGPEQPPKYQGREGVVVGSGSPIRLLI